MPKFTHHALLLSLPLLGLYACSSSEPPATSTDASSTQTDAEFVPRSKPFEGDFWAHRASYPTGHFQSSWVREGLAEHRQMPQGEPRGSADTARAMEKVGGTALDSTRFTSLGPQPLDSGSYGLVGGRVNVVLTNPGQPSVAWIAANAGGIWKTDNCCGPDTVWSLKSDDPLIAATAIGDLVMDPNNPDVLYAGTGDLRYGSFSFGAAGLLKSTDAGETWTALATDVFSPSFTPLIGNFPQYDAIGKIRVNPRNSDQLIVGTKRGLYFSIDGGEAWDGPCLTNPHDSQRQDITGLELIDTGSDTVMLAAVGVRGHATTVQPDLALNGANGLYRAIVPATGCPEVNDWTLVSRSDNGWPAGTGEGTPAPGNVLGRLEIAVAPSDPDILYVKSADIANRSVRGLWRSQDAGQNWVQVATQGAFIGCAGPGNQSWYNAGLLVHPENPDTLFASTVDLFRSTNSGTEFINQTCGYAGGNVHVDHHGRAFVGGDPNRLLIGTDGGVYYSENALAANPAFIAMNGGLSTMEFYFGDLTANFATASQRGASGGAQDNGSSTATWNGAVGPVQWTMRNGGDGIATLIEPVNALRWYYSSQNGNLVVSQTGPAGVRSSATGGWGQERRSFLMPFDLYRYGGASSGCPASPGCRFIIGGTHRVWESVQGGIPTTSWYVNSPDLTKNTLADRSIINKLRHAVSDPSVVVVATNDGNVQIGYGLNQGVANSATWVDLTDGNQILPNRPMMDVATDPLDPWTVYAAVGGFDQNTPQQPGHVFRASCTEFCDKFMWENKSGNLPNIPINAIIVNPLLPSQVFVGSDWGMYYTDDIDAAEPQWYAFREGLPNVMIWDMKIDRGFSTLAVFTRSRGAYAWPLPSLENLLFNDGFEDSGAASFAPGPGRVKP